MGPDPKKVGMDQIFLPCKPSVPCLHEMDLDSLFSGFGAIGAYGPKPKKKKKKTSPDPFCCSKAWCKCIFVPCHLLHVSLLCFIVVLHMFTIHYFLYNGVNSVKNTEKENDRVD